MEITYGGTILSRDYFRTWYSCMDEISGNKEEAELYNKCGEMCEWLTIAATESKKAKDLGVEDRIYPVFGLNGSSYQFYENAAKQIAEWARIYANLKYPDVYGQFNFEDFDLGVIVADKTVKNKAEKAKFTLSRILNKVELLKHDAIQREKQFKISNCNVDYRHDLERAVA